MRNILISTENYIDLETTFLNVQNQVPALPVTNLKNRQLTRVWRSTGRDAILTVDLGKNRLIGLGALISHNVPQEGKIQWRFSTEPSFSTVVFDTGLQNAWPFISTFGTLPWGVFEWGQTISDLEEEKYTINSYCIPPQDEYLIARYVQIILQNPSDKGDNWIQAGRLHIGAAFSPQINYAFGVSYEYRDDSTFSKSRGGQTYIDKRARYRVMRFELKYLNESEAFDTILNKIDRKLGISGDILVVPRPDEKNTWLTQNIFGRIQTITPVVNIGMDYYSKIIEIEELL